MESTESLETLLEKQKEISTQIESLQKQQKKEGLSKIVTIAEKYHLSPADISEALTKTKKIGKKRGSVPAKYRDPVTGSTWTGRGKPPAWIAGKDRVIFLIK